MPRVIYFEKAKKENYFGSLHSKKDLVGLIGYLRMNFAMQIRILTNCSNYFPIDTKFLEFLVIREWFKNAVLNNNKISHNLHFKGFSEFNFNSKKGFGEYIPLLRIFSSFVSKRNYTTCF